MRKVLLCAMAIAFAAVTSRIIEYVVGSSSSEFEIASLPAAARSTPKRPAVPVPTTAPPTTREVRAKELLKKEAAEALVVIQLAHPFVKDLADKHTNVAMPAEEKILKRMEDRYAAIGWNSFDNVKYPLMRPLGEALTIYRRVKTLRNEQLRAINRAIDSGLGQDETFRWADRELTSQIRDIEAAAWSKENEFLTAYRVLEQTYGNVPN